MSTIYIALLPKGACGSASWVSNTTHYDCCHYRSMQERNPFGQTAHPLLRVDAHHRGDRSIPSIVRSSPILSKLPLMAFPTEIAELLTCLPEDCGLPFFCPSFSNVPLRWFLPLVLGDRRRQLGCFCGDCLLIKCIAMACNILSPRNWKKL